MNIEKLYSNALNSEDLTLQEGLYLYDNAPTEDLIFIANRIRHKLHPSDEVGWMIDRNVNITNV